MPNERCQEKDEQIDADEIDVFYLLAWAAAAANNRRRNVVRFLGLTAFAALDCPPCAEP